LLIGFGRFVVGLLFVVRLVVAPVCSW